MSSQQQGIDSAVIVVTGGGSGIGRAIVRRLAEAKVSVVVADINRVTAQEVSRSVCEGGGRAWAVEMNVADPASVERAVGEIHAEAGPVWGLVNNAGVGSAGTVLTTELEEFERILKINVVGTYLVSRAILPDMVERRAGAVVNIGSIAGIVGIRDRAAYSASKGAVLALTRSLHADFYPYGIRVNAVVPGTVHTEWVERITQGYPDPAEAISQMAARQPIGRMGTPEEIAEAVWFLMSPGNTFSYGSSLVVDGGMTAL